MRECLHVEIITQITKNIVKLILLPRIINDATLLQTLYSYEVSTKLQFQRTRTQIHTHI